MKILRARKYSIHGDDFDAAYEDGAVGAKLHEPKEVKNDRADAWFTLVRKLGMLWRAPTVQFENCLTEDDFDRLCAAAKMAWREVHGLAD